MNENASPTGTPEAAWTEIRVLPKDMPRGSRYFNKRTSDGMLGCAIVPSRELAVRTTMVTVSHIANGEPDTIGRLPTLAEIADAVNSCCPRGHLYTLVIQSLDKAPDVGHTNYVILNELPIAAPGAAPSLVH